MGTSTSRTQAPNPHLLLLPTQPIIALVTRNQQMAGIVFLILLSCFYWDYEWIQTHQTPVSMTSVVFINIVLLLI